MKKRSTTLTVTLEVSPEGAVMLTKAMKAGPLELALCPREGP
jgi:Flp pilus assembly protein CpaB